MLSEQELKDKYFQIRVDRFNGEKSKDKKDAKPLELKGGRISFKNIKFSYDD